MIPQTKGIRQSGANFRIERADNQYVWEQSSFSRRRALGAFAGTAAAAWVAPAVIGSDRVAAATGSLGLLVTGAVTVGTLSPGESLLASANQYSDNNTMFVFEENTNVLTAGQATDSGMVLPSGITITSYLIHFSRQGGTGLVSGTITFPGTIVGWDFLDNDDAPAIPGLLPSSDSLWGVPGVTYQTNETTGRGFETGSDDSLSFDPPNCFLSLTLRTNSSFVDHIRVYVLA